MTEKEQEKLYRLIKEEILKYLSENDLKKGKKTSEPPKYTDIDAEIAERLIKRAILKAKELKVNITAAVVDKGGNLVLLRRMDKAIVASIDVAVKKAYSGLSLNCPTSQINLEEFPGLEQLMKDKIVLFGGGYPVKYKGNLIGGIGISGGNSKQDEEIAVFAIEDVIKNL